MSDPDTPIDTTPTSVAVIGGQVPTLETGLDALVTNGLRTGRLRFSTNHRTLSTAGGVMLCLPIPFQVEGGLDLGDIRDAAKSLRPLLAPGPLPLTSSNDSAAEAPR